jgi:hypothetical protein
MESYFFFFFLLPLRKLLIYAIHSGLPGFGFVVSFANSFHLVCFYFLYKKKLIVDNTFTQSQKDVYLGRTDNKVYEMTTCDFCAVSAITLILRLCLFW